MKSKKFVIPVKNGSATRDIRDLTNVDIFKDSHFKIQLIKAKRKIEGKPYLQYEIVSDAVDDLAVKELDLKD